jgi:hypothetical protein
MTERVPPQLDATYKERLKAKFLLEQEDEFYIVTKPGRAYQYELRPEFKAQAKETKGKSGIVTNNDVSFLVDRYIDMEKRMLYTETKMKKYKKLVKGLYEEVPTGETPEPEPEVPEVTPEEVEEVEETEPVKRSRRGPYGSRRS